MDECQLTGPQRRTVDALMRERQRVIDQANRDLAEIQEAIDVLARSLAANAGLQLAPDEPLEFVQQEANGPLVLRQARREPLQQEAT